MGLEFDWKPQVKMSERELEPPLMASIPVEEWLDFFCERNPTYPLAMLCSQFELLGRQLQKPTGVTVLTDAEFASTFSDSFIAL